MHETACNPALRLEERASMAVPLPFMVPVPQQACFLRCLLAGLHRNFS